MDDEIQSLLDISVFDEEQDQYSTSIYDATHIHILDDDCLIHIFEFLPIVDRIKIERVCKRWRKISRASWHDCKTLDLYQATWGLNCSNEKFVKNPRAVYEVLYRCGRFLRNLEFIGYIDELLSVGNKIGSLCPNLQSVSLSGVSSLVIKNIADHCSDIRNLYLRDTINQCDNELSLLLSRNQKLKALELVCEKKLDGGKFLLDLPTDTMDTLNILHSNVSAKYFNEAVRKLRNLSKVSFDFCDDFNDESLEAICSIRNLKELQTGLWLGRISSLFPVTKLTNLRTIEFSLSNYVNDEVLIAISNNCRQLTDVNISGCGVSDMSVAYITSLPNLQHLNIDYLNVTAKAFSPMPNLKTIECFMCKNVSNKCFRKLLRTSKNLELLNVCYCEVFNSLVKTAVFVTKERKNNITLKMYVQGTQIEVRKIIQVTPLLQVIHEQRKLKAKDYV